jgi:hypothetical protein
MDKYKQEDINAANKKICDEVKAKLKDPQTNLKRFKFIVHCIIGEKKGQGIKFGSKCFWDVNNDAMVSANYENDNLFAILTAFGVYYY